MVRTHNCKYCNKEFGYQQSKWLHEQSCKIKKGEREKEEFEFKLKKKQQEFEFKLREKQELLEFKFKLRQKERLEKEEKEKVVEQQNIKLELKQFPNTEIIKIKK
jgi:hypothetical protein